jgi:hypothetical protein
MRKRSLVVAAALLVSLFFVVAPPVQAALGQSACSAGETLQGFCGDGVCDAYRGENAATCAADCAPRTVTPTATSTARAAAPILIRTPTPVPTTSMPPTATPVPTVEPTDEAADREETAEPEQPGGAPTATETPQEVTGFGSGGTGGMPPPGLGDGLSLTSPAILVVSGLSILGLGVVGVLLLLLTRRRRKHTGRAGAGDQDD